MVELIENPTEPAAAETLLLQSQTEAAAALTALRNATVGSFRRFWHGPVPPADLFAVMGTKAVAAFERHGAAVQFLLSQGMEIDPADYTPPLAYTAHEDGTITLDPV